MESIVSMARCNNNNINDNTNTTITNNNVIGVCIYRDVMILVHLPMDISMMLRYHVIDTSVSGGKLKNDDQFFFATAWYKKNMRTQNWLLVGNFCARQVLSKTRFKSPLLLFACCLLQGKFSKKFKCLVKCNVCSCKSSFRWFKFSNFQRNFTKTYVHALRL